MASSLPATWNDNNNDASRYAALLPSPRPALSTTEKVLSASANVLHQLPTGSVMVFYALSSSFTNQEECRPPNWWLSLTLVILLTASGIFFSITDSFVFEGKLYYGVASPSRLILLNLNLSYEETKHFTVVHHAELKELRLRWDDHLHAINTALVFLAFAFGDIGIQNCFFPQAGFDTKQWLKNMPLLVVVLSSFGFAMCPTRRKSIIDFLTSGSCTTNSTALSSSSVTTSVL